jgi:hypothetical protein
MKKKQNSLKHLVVSGANIALFHILLVGIAFEAGLRLFQYGFKIDRFGVTLISCIVLGLVWACMKKWYGDSTLQPSVQRSLQNYLLMAFSGFMLCAVFFNYGIGGIIQEKEAVAAYLAIPVAIYSNAQRQLPEAKAEKKSLRIRAAEWRHSVRERVIAHFQQQQDFKDKPGKYILTFLLTCGLFLFFAILAFEGGPGVAIGGIGAILLITGLILYLILPKGEKKKAFWLSPLYFLGSIFFWFIFGRLLG